MDLAEYGQWIAGAKGTVDLLRSALALVPKGAKHDEIEMIIAAAEEALKRSDAQLARDLNMSLCNCTFPPQIMLWKEKEKADVCPNPECGRIKYKGMRISKEALEQVARPPHPQGWMGR